MHLIYAFFDEWGALIMHSLEAKIFIHDSCWQTFEQLISILITAEQNCCTLVI